MECRMGWSKDPHGTRGVYWSDDGRYCVMRTASTAVGPWVVSHDPDGRNAGWGEMVVRHAPSMREAKARAEVHAGKAA